VLKGGGSGTEELSVVRDMVSFWAGRNRLWVSGVGLEFTALTVATALLHRI
jgi:hypothetical protein